MGRGHGAASCIGEEAEGTDQRRADRGQRSKTQGRRTCTSVSLIPRLHRRWPGGDIMIVHTLCQRGIKLFQESEVHLVRLDALARANDVFFVVMVRWAW